MKAREGLKYVLFDSTFSKQTVSEWVFQGVIYRRSWFLFSSTLGNSFRITK